MTLTNFPETDRALVFPRPEKDSDEVRAGLIPPGSGFDSALDIGPCGSVIDIRAMDDEDDDADDFGDDEDVAEPDTSTPDNFDEFEDFDEEDFDDDFDDDFEEELSDDYEIEIEDELSNFEKEDDSEPLIDDEEF